MKNKKYWWLIALSLIPMTVFASDGPDLLAALFMEAFVTIHMSIFVLLPIAKAFKPDDHKPLFWKLFFIRIGVLLFFDLFITVNVAFYDFIAVFIGAFFVVPAITFIKKPAAAMPEAFINPATISDKPIDTNTIINNVVLKCANCGNVMKITDKFCTNCGKPFEGNNVTISTIAPPPPIVKPTVSASNFDNIYNLSEKMVVEEFIKRELVKAQIPLDTKMMPRDIVKRKKILNVIFSLLLFIFISLIFFHFPIYTYVIGIIILIVYAIMTRKMSIVKYLVKQVKSRPSEKISNIVMNTKTNLVTNNSRNILIVSILIAVILPIVIFFNPHMIYDHNDDGYVLRFYTFGISNFKEVTVPQTYKGEKVVGLRGNAFSNMFFLTKVSLPDTIKEIRGGAFANDMNLTDINMPEDLTYLGGEAFSGCSSLKNIVLPAGITEIKGNTFEECTSLESINIPDNVTRIGGHAFYGCSSLSKVTISENSKLVEIGSSAFRRCDSLYEIYIPATTSYSYRSFKESPTTIYRYGEENIDDNYNDYDYSNSNTNNYSNYNSQSNLNNSNNSLFNSLIKIVKDIMRG